MQATKLDKSQKKKNHEQVEAISFLSLLSSKQTWFEADSK